MYCNSLLWVIKLVVIVGDDRNKKGNGAFMRSIKRDLIILFNIALLLVASALFLHRRISAEQPVVKKSSTPIEMEMVIVNSKKEQKEEDKKIVLDVPNILRFFQPLLYARSIDAIARSTQQFDSNSIHAALPSLITDPESPLSSQDKVHLLLGIAYYHGDQKIKKELELTIRWLIEYKEAFKEAPIFFAAAQSRYASIIVDIKSFFEQSSDSEQKTLYKKWFAESLEKAIEEDATDTYQILNTYGITPDASLATQLLVRVVQEAKSQLFVPLLVKQGAHINYVDRSGHSILTMAIDQDNVIMVEALLKAGANPSYIPNENVGTPLQFAFSHGYIDIELLLRAYGAKQ